jgi:predicted nucleic acid-binding protein
LATQSEGRLRVRIVFDTGALIALERRQKTAMELVRIASEDGDTLIAPAAAVAEWWRAGKREKEREKILRAFKFETPDLWTAKMAGAAMGKVGAGLGDALVMATAGVQGDVVYTSDLEDLLRLREVFPNVTVLRI